MYLLDAHYGWKMGWHFVSNCDSYFEGFATEHTCPFDFVALKAFIKNQFSDCLSVPPFATFILLSLGMGITLW